MEVVDGAAWPVPWFFVVSVTVRPAPAAADETDAPTLETMRSGTLVGSCWAPMVTELIP